MPEPGPVTCLSGTQIYGHCTSIKDICFTQQRLHACGNRIRCVTRLMHALCVRPRIGVTCIDMLLPTYITPKCCCDSPCTRSRAMAVAGALRPSPLCFSRVRCTTFLSMQIPGVPSPVPQMVEPGQAQLEALTGDGQWCLTIVDIKMTTTQTPQGKKSRYSAMVMVGNLNVRAAAHCAAERIASQLCSRRAL